MKCVARNCVMEWSFNSTRRYRDPFNEVEYSVVFTGPEGEEKIVPGFWAGENNWRVRYSSPLTGRHSYRTICSDTSDSGLHGKQGEFEVVSYEGDNLLLRHGRLKISKDKRCLEHLDGTPFFWLGDTWWMGLCKRLSWPGDFRILTADRVDKGFTVIQIVAGLYPDMPLFDERGANEAGFPWEKDFQRINPHYFDLADLRIEWLVRSGLLPCIVGCWGYFLSRMSIEKMKKHWRYLVARYGAYPVVLCLAGEATMPYYLSEDKEKDAENQKKGWTEIAEYVREIDPFHNPLTIHPTQYGREQIEKPELIDFEMLQTGHGSHLSFSNTIKSLKLSLDKEPKMPVLVGEVCYEGILEASREEIQRLLFWGCMLSGAAGHTYGANGIWQVNRKERPFGPSPTGTSWGDTPWEEAYQLPGSKHLGIGKKLLERYPWWEIEPHQEWVETPPGNKDEYFLPYAAGIPGKLRLIYFSPFLPLARIKNLESRLTYRAFLFHPGTGQEYDLGKVTADKDGNYEPPKPPIFRDWLLVMEAQ